MGSGGADGHESLSGGNSTLPKPVEAGSLDIEGLLSMPLAQGRTHFEEWFVSKVLEACAGNQSEAARRLGVSRAGLFKKLKKLGLKG